MILIDSCSKIGNESLSVFGSILPSYEDCLLKNCPLIREHEIMGHILTKVTLQLLKHDHLKKSDLQFLDPNECTILI